MSDNKIAVAARTTFGWLRKLSLRNMSITRKFGLVSVILIVGFAALGGAYYRVTAVNAQASADIDEITRFGELSDRINIQFLEMRRLEKDFIIDQDTSVLPQHEAALAQVENLIGQILAAPPTEDTASLVEDMSLYLGLYEGSFNEMVTSMIAAGLDEQSGLLGQIITNAGGMAELLEGREALQLQNSLLRLRQMEGQYIEHPEAGISETLQEEMARFEILAAQSALGIEAKAQIQSQLDAYREAILAYGETKLQLLGERETFSDVALEFTPILASMRATKNNLLEASRTAASDSMKQISFIFAAVIVLVAGVVNLAFFSMSRLIGKPLRQAVELSSAIAGGQLDNEVEITSRDETGDLLQALRNMQAQLREQQDQLQRQMEEDRRRAEVSKKMAEESKRMAEEQARIATETGRIKQALDGVSSAVLMLDADLQIIYHNDAALQMFRTGKQEIRRALAGFDPEALLGKSFDYLYADAAEEGRLLKSLAQTHTSEKQLGGRIYRITVNPVLDKEGQRIGTVAEWSDRTEEIAIEDEVQAMVSAAKEGDLSQRIDLANKSGFFHGLSDGVNQLVEVAEKVIQDTVVVLGALAKGDLTHTMDGDFAGVFAQLKTDVNATVEKLTYVVRNIQSGAKSVDRVALEIANSNAEVSSRTEQQAAVLEETASAMEQMTATVRQTASNTVEANKLAGEARNQAEAGGEIVGQAIAAMTDINASSNQISNIIGVIDEISFQTNLLALNAAVEAARAGEQGRGFAVVADEVRQLAANSANAAKEIKELIDHSNQQITRGTELVNKSGDALHAIVESVKQVTTIISEIATASQEQADGIAQVNASIASMDEGTQQNAAMVEQVTGASDTMGEEAHKLNMMMTFFNIGEAAAPANTGEIEQAEVL